LKFAGYDGVVIQGRADKPVWIYVHDGKADIRDAGKLWGLDTYSVQEAIWAELGSKKVKVLCIGPAGERLVRFATIATDNGNHSGVGGTGAVMGSKNLKAIAVRGTGKVEVAKPEELKELAFKMHRYRYRPEARPPMSMYAAQRAREEGHAQGKGVLGVSHCMPDGLFSSGRNSVRHLEFLCCTVSVS
jgi:aldehyde:ferredoxin oxidoreductase